MFYFTCNHGLSVCTPPCCVSVLSAIEMLREIALYKFIIDINVNTVLKTESSVANLTRKGQHAKRPLQFLRQGQGHLLR